MINQFHEMMRFYKKLRDTNNYLFTDEEALEQEERLKEFPILIKELNKFVNQLEDIDTSIEKREEITTLLIDAYVMVEKVSWQIAHMTDFCSEVNGKYWEKHNQFDATTDK